MNKENVIYTYSGILFTFRKKGILQDVTMWMILVDIMLSERSQPSHKSSYMRCKKSQTHRDEEGKMGIINEYKVLIMEDE